MGVPCPPQVLAQFVLCIRWIMDKQCQDADGSYDDRGQDDEQYTGKAS